MQKEEQAENLVIKPIDFVEANAEQIDEVINKAPK